MEKTDICLQDNKDLFQSISLLNLPASGLLDEVEVLRNPGISMGKSRLASGAGNEGSNSNLFVDVVAIGEVEGAARVTAADTRAILGVDADVSLGDGAAVGVVTHRVSQDNPVLSLVEGGGGAAAIVGELAPASGDGALASESCADIAPGGQASGPDGIWNSL